MAFICAMRAAKDSFTGVSSPHPAGLRADHRRAGLARERLRELRHVHDDAVDAVLPGRVRIRDRVRALVLGPLVLAVPLREADEEALVGREAVAGLELLVL